MFDGCVRVPSRDNCANCPIGGNYKRCSLRSGTPTAMPVQHGLPRENTTNAHQLLDEARKKRTDLQDLVEQNQYIVILPKFILGVALGRVLKLFMFLFQSPSFSFTFSFYFSSTLPPFHSLFLWQLL